MFFTKVAKLIRSFGRLSFGQKISVITVAIMLATLVLDILSAILAFAG